MVLFCLLPFIRNLFLVHHQLAIVMVARIRLLWILEVLIQLRKRRHHRRHFCPYWTDIISSDWYYFLPLQNPGSKSISTSETLFRRNMRMVRVIRRFTKASVRIHVAQLKWPEVIHWRSLRNPYVAKYLWWPWQWRIDVKEKRIFSPDKIFTASKASRRNLWSFVMLAKNSSHRNGFALTDFFANQTNFRVVRTGLQKSSKCLKLFTIRCYRLYSNLSSTQVTHTTHSTKIIIYQGSLASLLVKYCVSGNFSLMVMTEKLSN